MSNVYATSPIHSFRGIPFPVTSRSIRYANDEVQHASEYKNGKFVELTSGGNDIYRYTIPGRDGLQPAQYKLWFSTYYNSFIDAIKDRSAGELIDSLRGNIRVKPVSLVEDSAIDKLDGVDFDVEFIEAPEVLETYEFDSSILGVVALSDAIDQEASVIEWEDGYAPDPLTSKGQEYRTTFLESQAELSALVANTRAAIDPSRFKPPQPIVNPIDSVTGMLRRAQQATSQPAAIFNDSILRMKKMEEATRDRLEPQLFGLQQSIRSARLQTYRVKRDFETNNGRARFEFLREDMTVIEAANQYGMPVQEFLRMNPKLAKYTILPQGTRVTYVVRAA